jgi:hypothetical protein
MKLAYRKRLYGLDFHVLSLQEVKDQLARSKPIVKRTSQIAIYSGYFGTSQNKTFTKNVLPKGYDFYFISNNDDVLKLAEKQGWIGIKFETEVSENQLLSCFQGKIPKVLPHLFPQLQGYTYLFWLDDKKRVTEKMSSLISQMVTQNASMSLREHPDLKGNILLELAECLIQRRYKAQLSQMVGYIADEIKAGFTLQPDRLFWASAILRNMNHPDAVKINEAWYTHILRCGIEDQISFDFVAQRFNSIHTMQNEIE